MFGCLSMCYAKAYSHRYSPIFNCCYSSLIFIFLAMKTPKLYSFLPPERGGGSTDTKPDGSGGCQIKYTISASSITETKSYKRHLNQKSDQNVVLMFMILACVQWNLTLMKVTHCQVLTSSSHTT